MSHLILAEITASVSELKKNPMGTVAAGKASSCHPEPECPSVLLRAGEGV